MGLYDPDSIYVKFKYTTYVDWTPSGKLFYAYSGNSPYDPDVTGVGLTAAGFNAHMARYGKYLCYASKIRLIQTQTHNGDVFGQTYGRVTILPCLQPTDPGYNTSSWEPPNQKYAKWMLIPNEYSRPRTMKYFMTTKKMFGTRDTYDDNFTGTVSTNPNSLNRWYWTVIWDTPFGVTDVDSVHAQIQITYYCKLFQLINNATIETVL